MTAQVRNLLEQYTLRARRDRASGSPLFFAWYEELPGCVAQANSRDSAVRELDTIAAAVLEVLESERLPLPVPFSLRGNQPVTQEIQVNGILVGNLPTASPSEGSKLASAGMMESHGGKLVAA